MDRWKYTVYEVSYKSSGEADLKTELNEFGENGWELVSNQIKPIKNERTNSFDMVCVFKKLI